MQRIARELDEAMADDVYGGSYFGEGRNPLDRMGLSGYERYDRHTSNADVAAYLVWRFFPVRRALDVGCALGYVVEALRELGVEAEGTDISQWAVDHAAPGARGHVFWGNLLHRLPVPDGRYDLVTALETLEHLPPDVIPAALRELRRVAKSYVVATIPSFGPNDHGPDGWFDVKVRPERLDHYRSLGPDYDGPVPYDDLFRDAQGEPVEGHLTIASFRWWTRQFEGAGFVRCGATERLIHPHLARFGLTKYWNLYVLRAPDAPEPTDAVRSPTKIAAVERRWGLDGRSADPDDLRAVEQALADRSPR
ncbi:MAG TPA: methyltransferase domain-containing protein [Acidimicrobiales bacterium]|nr:methyltransferase domain-containing protein [Acidimicrobiales bacterium]